MLAKEIKIMTILKQREFIRQQLEDTVYAVNGNPTYTYIGHIYPENLEYFYKDGWDIREVKCETLIADAEGLPIWLLAPKDDIILTEEEMQEAEMYIKSSKKDDEEEVQETRKLHFICNSLS